MTHQIFKLGLAAALLMPGLGAYAAEVAPSGAADGVPGIATAAATPVSPANRSGSCVKTGSRIQAKGPCVDPPGQVVSHEELQSTGANDMGQALRQTVPAAMGH